MQVSKNSWHYELYCLYWYDAPSTICAYFWKTLWSGFIALVLAAMALLLTVVGPAYSTYAYIWGAEPWTALLMGWILYILMAVVLVVGGVPLLFKEAPRGSFRHVTTERLRAAKEKVCPRVEVVED